MKFSKKSRYGLRALIDLSIYGEEGQVSLASIAERNDISPQYLEQVFSSLRRGGIVRSVKGPFGGYQLRERPEKISVARILEVLEGDFRLEDEEASATCPFPGAAEAVQDLVIEKINQNLEEILSGLSLETLRKQSQVRDMARTDMYYI